MKKSVSMIKDLLDDIRYCTDDASSLLQFRLFETFVEGMYCGPKITLAQKNRLLELAYAAARIGDRPFPVKGSEIKLLIEQILRGE